jgi:integrase/recombinase XerC
MASLQLSVARLDKAIKGFLDESLKEKSKETYGTYERALREFSKYHGRAETWFRFQAPDIEKYRDYLRTEKKYKDASVATYLTALRKLMDYFVAEGLLDENESKKVKGSRRPHKHNADTLSEAEVKKLLAIIPTSKLQDHRDYLVIRLMIEAAAAEHELVKASVEDLKKYQAQYVLFVQAKRQKTKEDRIEIGLELGRDIEAYLERRIVEPHSPLFSSHGGRSNETYLTPRAIHYRICHWLEVAGISRKTVKPHSLRHTAAKLWLERDKLSLDEVKRRMRHGIIATTKIYTGEVEPEDQLIH